MELSSLSLNLFSVKKVKNYPLKIVLIIFTSCPKLWIHIRMFVSGSTVTHKSKKKVWRVIFQWKKAHIFFRTGTSLKHFRKDLSKMGFETKFNRKNASKRTKKVQRFLSGPFFIKQTYKKERQKRSYFFRRNKFVKN